MSRRSHRPVYSRRSCLRQTAHAVLVGLAAPLIGCGKKGQPLAAPLELRMGVNDEPYAKQLLAWLEQLPPKPFLDGRRAPFVNTDIVRIRSRSLETLRETILEPLAAGDDPGPPPLPEHVAVGYEYRTWEIEESDDDYEEYRLHLWRTDRGFRLTNATVEELAPDEFSAGRIRVVLSEQDAKAFGTLTEGIVNRELIVVLGQEVLSSPKVLEPIRGGTITLGYDDPVRSKTLFNTLTRDS